MYQRFPYPEELDDLVDKIKYKEGWKFELAPEYDRGQGSEGYTLEIRILCPNSYNPSQMRAVAHLFPVPPAAYNRGSWQRWLLDMILLVERHEALEFFQIGDRRPYAPNHGPGHDPYTIREQATDEERRTSFRGDVKEE